MFDDVKNRRSSSGDARRHRQVKIEPLRYFCARGLWLAVGDEIEVNPPQADGDQHAEHGRDAHHPRQVGMFGHTTYRSYYHFSQNNNRKEAEAFDH